MTTILQTCGRMLSVLSIIVLLLTVSSLPWMLGGVIPLARLVLLCGAIVAAVLSILSNVLQRQLPTAVPAVMIPLTGLALLGMFQLRPAAEHPALHMQHAVLAPALAAETPQPTHSLSPADTRSTVGTLLALTLLACVAFDRIRRPQAVFWSCCVAMANGLAITVVGLIHLFHNKPFQWNETFLFDKQRPAETLNATFVNPNNAAGWLCLTGAVAAGWITWHLKSAPSAPKLRRGRLQIEFWGRLWQRSIEFVGDLTVWQILSFTAIAFLAVGVAATRSRGGILALCFAALVTAGLRTSIRSLPVALGLLITCGTAAFATLTWLELDTGVVSEMETLNDLNEAAGSRPTHWRDSLHAVLDFPVVGTGLGAYRFATLPYQTVFHQAWFQNGDNHFVDMVVDGGLVGLLLFLAAGGCGLFAGFAAWRAEKRKRKPIDKSAPRISRRVLAGLGATAILATLSQAVSGFLDYGVGMPAAAALWVLLIGSTAGVVAESKALDDDRNSVTSRRRLIAVLAVQLCLAGAATSFVTDQVAATEIDRPVVRAHRLLDLPIAPDQLDQLHATRSELETRLADRPDDAAGVTMLSKLADAEFRWAFLRLAAGDDVGSQSNFAALWADASMPELADRLWRLHRQDPQLASTLRTQVSDLIQQVGLDVTLNRLQQQFPLTRAVAMDQAAVAAVNDDLESFIRQAEAAEFADPSNAARLFNLGSLALRFDQPELAQDIWDRSLTLTDQFRSRILTDAQNHWSFAQALERFGPQDYVACVQAAEGPQSANQRTQLWDRAESFWEQSTQPVSSEMAEARLRHLLATDRSSDARTWLEVTLKEHPDHIPLRSQYAKLLEQDGQFREALEEWLRIQYADPKNAEADTAITHIRRMKSAPKK